MVGDMHGDYIFDRRYAQYWEPGYLDAAPKLFPEDTVRIAPIERPVDGIDLFQHIARLYSDAVNSGHKNLRLTLVGLDEFDKVRDEEAKGDAKFDAIFDQFPWPDVDEARRLSTRFPYSAVAPSFVDNVSKLVDPNIVRKNVQVLSTAAYLGSLDALTREQEDWFQNERIEPWE
jgi:hypothetical protein